jgi:hypothetical protein
MALSPLDCQEERRTGQNSDHVGQAHAQFALV